MIDQLIEELPKLPHLKSLGCFFYRDGIYISAENLTRLINQVPNLKSLDLGICGYLDFVQWDNVNLEHIEKLDG